MTSRQIKTIFSCNCQSCGNQISKGEMVWYKKGYGCRCLTCGKHNESAQRSKHSSRQPKPAPAPKPFIPANIPQWPDTAFETQQEKEKSI
ncbi:MAG TPA: hypothetical protein DCP47_02660, partial [Phycisphaerales bacterium]|nr:hypothetical protein [Phycisphaerales bacterium]